MQQHITPRTIYLLTFILAACSILYELLIAHTISLLAANTVVWYSITIGLYLGAMGIGAFFTPKKQDLIVTITTLIRVELALVLIGFLSVPLIHFAQSVHAWALINSLLTVAGFVFPFVALTTIILIGFLSGRELPLLIHMGNSIADTRVTNRVLAMDYIGSLAGAVLLPLLLLPHLNNFLIATLIAGLNLIVALYLVITQYARLSNKLFVVTATSSLITILILTGIFNTQVEQIFLKKYYYYQYTDSSFSSLFTSTRTFPDIDRTHSPYQRIDMVTMLEREYEPELLTAYSSKYIENPWYPKNAILFINGDFQVYSDIDEFYHEWFAHVPIIISGKVPERVLVLGGGDGILDKELLKHSGIQTITHIDIDPEILRLAKYHPALRAMNDSALSDPRVRERATDAYQYIRTTEEMFDAIYIDFPYAQDYNVARLFSREFYHFIKKRLNPDGFIVFDAPNSGFTWGTDSYGEAALQEGESWPSYYHTLRAAGFETIVPYSTMLEKNNAAAFEALKSLEYSFVDDTGARATVPEAEAEALRSEYARQEIDIFVNVLSQGFIMAMGTDGKPRTTYKDLGVQLHALTKNRFVESVNLPYSNPGAINWNQVNSIFKPVIEGPEYMVRRPY